MKDFNVRETDIIQSYNPDEDGWCGYRSLAYQVIGCAGLADRMGWLIRIILHETLLAYRAGWITLWGHSRYNNLIKRTTSIPNDTRDWWFCTDLFWVASITFEQNFVYHSEWENHISKNPAHKGTLIVRYPMSLPVEPIVFYASQDHMWAIKMTSLQVELFHDETQDKFEEIFCSVVVGAKPVADIIWRRLFDALNSLMSINEILPVIMTSGLFKVKYNKRNLVLLNQKTNTTINLNTLPSLDRLVQLKMSIETTLLSPDIVMLADMGIYNIFQLVDIGLKPEVYNEDYFPASFYAFQHMQQRNVGREKYTLQVYPHNKDARGKLNTMIKLGAKINIIVQYFNGNILQVFTPPLFVFPFSSHTIAQLRMVFAA